MGPIVIHNGPIVIYNGPIVIYNGPIVIYNGPIVNDNGPIVNYNGPLSFIRTNLGKCDGIRWKRQCGQLPAIVIYNGLDYLKFLGHCKLQRAHCKLQRGPL